MTTEAITSWQDLPRELQVSSNTNFISTTNNWKIVLIVLIYIFSDDDLSILRSAVACKNLPREQGYVRLICVLLFRLSLHNF